MPRPRGPPHTSQRQHTQSRRGRWGRRRPPAASTARLGARRPRLRPPAAAAAPLPPLAPRRPCSPSGRGAVCECKRQGRGCLSVEFSRLGFLSLVLLLPVHAHLRTSWSSRSTRACCQSSSLVSGRRSTRVRTQATWMQGGWLPQAQRTGLPRRTLKLLRRRCSRTTKADGPGRATSSSRASRAAAMAAAAAAGHARTYAAARSAMGTEKERGERRKKERTRTAGKYGPALRSCGD